MNLWNPTPVSLLSRTWKEIAELDPDSTLFIIPTGAVEQHGPHLPLDTDIFNANAIAMQIAEQTPGVTAIVLPPIWWGTSPHHKGYPGTISLRLETFYSLLHDVVESLARHNFYRFLVLNGHGGNIGIITAATSQIGDDLGISIPAYSYWQSIRSVLIEIGDSETGGMGHACEMETSLALHLRPNLVNLTEINADLPDLKTPWSCIDFRASGFLGIPLDFQRDSKQGVMGDPTYATAEKGKIIFDAACETGSEVIAKLKLLSKQSLTTANYKNFH